MSTNNLLNIFIWIVLAVAAGSIVWWIVGQLGLSPLARKIILIAGAVLLLIFIVGLMGGGLPRLYR